MFGKKRHFVIMYFLAAAILMLFLTGDGSKALQKMSGANYVELEHSAPEVSAVRTELVLMNDTPWETTLYKITAPVKGPTVMVIGGIHGDESAGFYAADEVSTWVIDRGTLLVLPRANVPAIEEESRKAPGEADLNRVFPGDSNGNAVDKLAAEIMETIITYEPVWIIDLHEAEYCERLFPGALGQTLLYPRKAGSIDIVEEVQTIINRSINNEDKHFLLLRGVVHGSAVKSALLAGSDAMIVETCEQMPLEERIQYQLNAVSALLYTLGITVY